MYIEERKTYVLVTANEGMTSQSVRELVFEELSQDLSFRNYSRQFALPVCDEFRVGGPFSGHLCPQSNLDGFFSKANEIQPALECKISKTCKERQDASHITYGHVKTQVKKLWKSMGRKYDAPMMRDGTASYGYNDDACILNQWLAEELNMYLSAPYDPTEYAIWEEHMAIPPVVTLEPDIVKSIDDFHDVIGKYWVVLLHCQNWLF